MTMQWTRRQALGLGVAATAVMVAGIRVSPALAADDEVTAAIKAFVGGAEAAEGKITLDTPEIAENGNTVPIGVSVDSPMTADDHVTSVMILAEGNPRPGVVTFRFTPMSGEAAAKTRMRLSKTQDVIALAKMSNGQVFTVRNTVKVTIGGCGG